MADPVTSNTATVVVQAVDKDKITIKHNIFIRLHSRQHLALDDVTVCDAQLFQHLHSGKCL